MSYSRFFTLLREVNKQGTSYTYKELVSHFTKGRTDSLKSISQNEYNELCNSLEVMLPKYKNDKARKAIIAIFKSIGKTTTEAIVWAENNGVDGQKKKFNDYNGQELVKLIRVAEKIKQHKIKSIQ
jgi:hypothetical protein